MATIEDVLAPHRSRGIADLRDESKAPSGPAGLDEVDVGAFRSTTFGLDDPLLFDDERGEDLPQQYDADIVERQRRLRLAAAPKLVLGFAEAAPVLRDRPDWRLLRHQTAGYACHSVRLCVLRLRPTPAMAEVMEAAARHWDGSQDSTPADLDAILAWRGMLRSVGADCRWTYHRFQEGLYPVDATDEVLSAIAEPDDRGPMLIDDLVDADRSSPWLWSNCLGVFVLTENSD